MWGHNCGWWGPGYFFGWPWGMLMGIIFCGLVIYGIFRLVSGMSKRPSEELKAQTPLEILKKRYAAGEIDAEEFAKKKKDLGL